MAAIEMSQDTTPMDLGLPTADGGDNEDLDRMRDGKFTEEELEKFERPRNMFDVTDMTYEEYVEKHYDIMGKKHNEQLLKTQMAMMQQMMSQPGGFGAPGGMMAGGGAGYGGQGAGMGAYGGFGQGGGNTGGPMPPRPPPGYCNAFQRGMCKFGDNCRYKHEIWDPSTAPAAPSQQMGQFPPRDPNRPAGYCNAFQKGECKFGDQCRYRHEINPRPYNPDFARQRQNNFGMVNTNLSNSGGATGAFAAAGYGGF